MVNLKFDTTKLFTKLYNIITWILLVAIGMSGIGFIIFSVTWNPEEKPAPIYSYRVYQDNSKLKMYAAKSELVDSINSYISSISKYSNLNGSVLVEKCEQYDIDIIFVLAQGQLESCFGTQGIASKTNSVWNVYSWDNRSAEDIIKKNQNYHHPDDSIEPYLQLLVNNYLNGVNETDLMDNFVNNRGERYASDENYEEKLKNIYNRIKKSTNIKDIYSKYKFYKTLTE